MELASPSSPPPPDALGHPSVTFVDSRSCGRVKLFVGGPDRFLGHEGGDPRNALREVRLRRSDGDERPSHGEGKGVGLRPVCGPGSPERSLKVKDTDPVIDGRMIGDSSCILIVGKEKTKRKQSSLKKLFCADSSLFLPMPLLNPDYRTGENVAEA